MLSVSSGAWAGLNTPKDLDVSNVPENKQSKTETEDKQSKTEVEQAEEAEEVQDQSLKQPKAEQTEEVEDKQSKTETEDQSPKQAEACNHQCKLRCWHGSANCTSYSLR